MTDDRSFVHNLVSTYFYSAVTLQTSYRYDECLPFAVDFFYWNNFLTPTPCMVCMYIIHSRQSSSRQLLCCYGLLQVCSSPVRWTLVDLPTAPLESCITYLNNMRNPVCVPYTTSGRTKESDCLLALCRTCVLFVYILSRVLWTTWHTKISLTQEMRTAERIFLYKDQPSHMFAWDKTLSYFSD